MIEIMCTNLCQEVGQVEESDENDGGPRANGTVLHLSHNSRKQEEGDQVAGHDGH